MKINRIHSLILFLTIVSLPACNQVSNHIKDNHAHKEVQEENTVASETSLYTCPMHPEIAQTDPGICPICKMDLIKAEVNERKSQTSTETNAVNSTVLANVTAVKVVSKELPLTVHSTGTITFNTSKIYNISAWTGGRIEELYAKYQYQYIPQGAPLFSIYSHELLKAQQNYLFIKENDSHSTELLNAAKEKLKLLGMKDKQINELKDGHIHAKTTVYSPYSGYLIDMNRAPLRKTMSSNGMGEDVAETMLESNQTLSLKEGATVQRGETVLKVANTETVWAVLELNGTEAALVKIGQKVRITGDAIKNTLSGIVDFIEPFTEAGSPFVKARILVENKEGWLKPGMLVQATIFAGNHQSLWVPETAVTDLGKKKIVFIQDGASFIAKEVKTGYTSLSYIEIIDGLTSNQSVASQAGYLVDSESFIKPL